MTLVPIEYENAMESKLLNLTPINKLPIEFEISKYGKVKIDNFIYNSKLYLKNEI